MPTFNARTLLPCTPAEAFAWHASPGALVRMTPPWSGVRLLSPPTALAPGSRVALAVPGPGGLRRRWLAEHRDVVPGRQFVDVQIQGPFRAWQHVHRFLEAPGGCALEDEIAFTAPAGTAWMVDRLVQGQLARLFAWRHARLREDLVRHRAAGLATQRILITGAAGLVGSALAALLTAGGHEVVPLRRGPAWDPAAGRLDPRILEGVGAVVHLAGATVARRWTAAVRQDIVASRVGSTALLAEALARMRQPPKTLVVASAVGAYGEAGERICGEDAPLGQGFLADVCRAWEAAADPARAAGIRTVHLRIGAVLAGDGGALGAMLPAFRAGLGGRLGSGRQWMSWIGRDDLTYAVLAALADQRLEGPVNAVAPRAVRQGDFATTLAGVLGRPAVLPMPAWAVGALFGDMGRGLLLASCNAEPGRLGASGFGWTHGDLATALRWELGIA